MAIGGDFPFELFGARARGDPPGKEGLGDFLRLRRTDVRWRKWDIMQFHSERMIVELVNNGPGKGRIYLFIPPLA